MLKIGYDENSNFARSGTYKNDTKFILTYGV